MVGVGHVLGFAEAVEVVVHDAHLPDRPDAGVVGVVVEVLRRQDVIEGVVEAFVDVGDVDVAQAAELLERRSRVETPGGLEAG